MEEYSRIDGGDLKDLKRRAGVVHKGSSSNYIPKEYWNAAPERTTDLVIDSHGNTGNIRELERMALQRTLAIIKPLK